MTGMKCKLDEEVTHKSDLNQRILELTQEIKKIQGEKTHIISHHEIEIK